MSHTTHVHVTFDTSRIRAALGGVAKREEPPEERRLVAGPLVGWKVADVGEDHRGDVRLMPTSWNATAHRTDGPSASCRRRCPQVPSVDHLCGYNAYADRAAALAHLSPHRIATPRVLMQVALSGRTIVHADGWRAERQRIVRLFATPDVDADTRAALLAGYGLPVEPVPDGWWDDVPDDPGGGATLASLHALVSMGRAAAEFERAMQSLAVSLGNTVDEVAAGMQRMMEAIRPPIETVTPPRPTCFAEALEAKRIRDGQRAARLDRLDARDRRRRAFAPAVVPPRRTPRPRASRIT